MPRLYTCSFKNVTIAAAQDLISVLGVTNRVIRIQRIWLAMNDTTLQTAQGLRLNLKRGTATVTPGSGGAAVTPTPLDSGDVAATFTSRRNDTTPATTSGAFTDLFPCGGHNYGGLNVNFGNNGPLCIEGQTMIFELLSTVSGTCNFSGGMICEELG